MRLLTDVTPLREHPAFRRLWLGTMLSRTGSAMTTFAISLQVFDLTRSTAAVGGIGLATFLPLLDTFTVVARGIIVQTVTPDELLGRVNAADFLVGAGGGQLGSLEAGLVGSWTTPVISALSGGLLTIFGTLVIGAGLPAFRRYRVPVPPDQAEAHGSGPQEPSRAGAQRADPGAPPSLSAPAPGGPSLEDPGQVLSSQDGA